MFAVTRLANDHLNGRDRGMPEEGFHGPAKHGLSSKAANIASGLDPERHAAPARPARRPQ